MPKRFEKYGLTLHPEKTRLVPFERPAAGPGRPGTPERTAAGTFDLLGFTHYWGRSRNGYWVVKRKTAQGRLSRALTTIAQWCRLNRHQPIADQHRTLSQKNCVAISLTLGSPATALRCRGFGGRWSTSGRSGWRAADGAVSSLGAPSSGCCGVTRCHRRWRSTRCAVLRVKP